MVGIITILPEIITISKKLYANCQFPKTHTYNFKRSLPKLWWAPASKFVPFYESPRIHTSMYLCVQAHSQSLETDTVSWMETIALRPLCWASSFRQSSDSPPCWVRAKAKAEWTYAGAGLWRVLKMPSLWVFDQRDHEPISSHRVREGRRPLLASSPGILHQHSAHWHGSLCGMPRFSMTHFFCPQNHSISTSAF